MASTTLKLSKRVNAQGKSQLKIKLTINRNCRPCFDTECYLRPCYFHETTLKGTTGNLQIIEPPRLRKNNSAEVKDVCLVRTLVYDMANRLTAIAEALIFGEPDKVTKENVEEAYWLTRDITVTQITYSLIELLRKKHNADAEAKRLGPKKSFEGYFTEFLEEKKLAPARENSYMVILRALLRFRAYKRKYGDGTQNFTLDIDTIDKNIIDEFFTYIEKEYELAKQEPAFFKKLLKETCSHNIQQRGSNTIVDKKKKFKAFWHWLLHNGITKNDPVKDLETGKTVYGDPYFITTEERNKIFTEDLINDWKQFKEDIKSGKVENWRRMGFSLATILNQRDIFVFNCEVGCRVSDLMKLTYANVQNGILTYIPEKTKNITGITVKIPLMKESLNLIEKYRGKTKDDKLFPFITQQRYNDSIKLIFRLTGINRLVTIRDSKTGAEKEVPISDVASSHIARRTFIGNLYNKVKDPSIICNMSGHVEDSKAFARYREISMDIKREIMKELE